MKQGAFTFVLHCHLPYCRRAGRWPHGEEWLHEALSGTYLPLLNALYDLKEEGFPFHLTLGLTPVLVEQLADSLILEHFHTYLNDKMERAAADLKRFENQGHMTYLASFYLKHYEKLLHSYEHRFRYNIISAFKRLQDEGNLEIITSAATHGYLPLLERDSSIYGQLAVGAQSYQRHFKRKPKAVWLPECGYRPPHYAMVGDRRYLKPGFEQFLAELGLGLFFSETHVVEGGEPVGKARGEVIGPYGSIPKRYVVPLPSPQEPTMKTTFLPYWVQSTEVAVLGRNNRTGMQVWSAEWGYPGDYNYSEFHKKDGISGLRYWKVTGARLDLAFKDFYDPYWAERRAIEHAEHYSWLVTDLLSDFYRHHGKFGIIVAAYDTELFGHWWFEGILWLKEVLRRLSRSDVVELTTASRFIEQHPPEDVMALPEGSWGQAGNHFTWLNVDTDWMWPLVHQAELKMEELVARYPSAEGNMALVLQQAARELLLLQSSDWPFLVTTGQAREYAANRFQEHVDRFNKLAEIATSGQAAEEARCLAQELFETDKLFPDIDYRLFAYRERQD